MTGFMYLRCLQFLPKQINKAIFRVGGFLCWVLWAQIKHSLFTSRGQGCGPTHTVPMCHDLLSIHIFTMEPAGLR